MRKYLPLSAILCSSILLSACATKPSIDPDLALKQKYDREYNYLFVHNDDLNPAWRYLENYRLNYEAEPTEEKYSRYVYLYNRYADTIDARNFSTQNYLNTTRRLHATWNNIGRGGAIEKQPGYIHVLGGTAAYNNIPVRSSVKKRPRYNATPTLNAHDRAWSRYCNQGIGMTAQDWEIINEANGVIPAKFRKNCLPPK